MNGLLSIQQPGADRVGGIGVGQKTLHGGGRTPEMGQRPRKREGGDHVGWYRMLFAFGSHGIPRFRKERWVVASRCVYSARLFVRRRWRRSEGIVPPHTPCDWPVVTAKVRHSERTGQARHTAIARRLSSLSSENQQPGSGWPAQRVKCRHVAVDGACVVQRSSAITVGVMKKRSTPGASTLMRITLRVRNGRRR